MPRKSKLTTGDARRMAADDLYAMLEKVVDQYQYLDRIYFIMVIVKNNYQGPAPFKNADAGTAVETTEMKIPDKIVHNRIVAPMFKPPIIRQLGSMLWRVDNRRGDLSLVYALPQDVPTLQGDSDNEGKVIPKVAESVQGIPLIWN